MKRSGFKRPVIERKPSPLYRLARQCTQAVVDDVPRAVPKDAPTRDADYRRLVAALPCIACGAVGRSQAAHPNTGKGMGMKADDRLCFPLCADAPGVVGCHTRFDQGAMFTKDERREIEPRWGRETASLLGRGIDGDGSESGARPCAAVDPRLH